MASQDEVIQSRGDAIAYQMSLGAARLREQRKNPEPYLYAWVDYYKSHLQEVRSVNPLGLIIQKWLLKDLRFLSEEKRQQHGVQYHIMKQERRECARIVDRIRSRLQL